MSLADDLKQLNEQAGEILAMMRASAEARRSEEAREAAKPSPWRNGEPRQLNATAIFLAIPGGIDMLRDEFKVVPESYYEIVDDTTRITCPCGFASHLLGLGALHECKGCGRYYYAGRVLRASSPEAQAQAA